MGLGVRCPGGVATPDQTDDGGEIGPERAGDLEERTRVTIDRRSEENAMRTVFGLALTGALVLGHADDVRSQGAKIGGVPYGNRYYPPTPPAAPYQRVYSYADEPLMSINRSYLGYSNFVSSAPGLPPGGYATGYRYVPAPGYVTPAPRGFRRFGWWRYRY
jgi:hypothetical protein